MRKLVAGNWKMNGLRVSLKNIAELAKAHASARIDLMICPPATLLSQACEFNKSLKIGAQDCHSAEKGAHTGDIAAQMIADCGATAVILGHSERRENHSETDAMVRQKTIAAQSAGLTAVVCIGETLEQREKEETLHVLETQLEGSIPDKVDSDLLVVAYEPVWAIGTGNIPTREQIAEAHAFCRRALLEKVGSSANNLPLLYGGSVNASNADEIFALKNVDGALVGGASLLPTDFSPIIYALEATV